MSERYLTVKQVALKLAVSETTVRVMIRSGRLKADKARRCLMIRRSELDQFFDGGDEGSPPEKNFDEEREGESEAHREVERLAGKRIPTGAELARSLKEGKGR